MKDIPLLILVLGVHRSGTSLLTASLRALGLVAGEFCDTKDADNPTGYHEHPSVRTFNDRLLEHLGTSWDNWGFRAGTVDFDDPNLVGWRDEAVALLRDTFKGSGPFVLKDPRISTLLPFWQRVVPAAGFALRRILIVRNPVEVAESQLQRAARGVHEFLIINGPEPMAALWAVTMHEMLSSLSDDQTFVLDHAQLVANPLATLASVVDFLNLGVEAGGLVPLDHNVVKPELYRARASCLHKSDGPWMSLARELYATLSTPITPRMITAEEGRRIANAKKELSHMFDGLEAVRHSIHSVLMARSLQLRTVSEQNQLLWIINATIGNIPTPLLKDTADTIIRFKWNYLHEQQHFAAIHVICLILIKANRIEEAKAQLEAVKTECGHLSSYQSLEAKIFSRLEAREKSENRVN